MASTRCNIQQELKPINSTIMSKLTSEAKEDIADMLHETYHAGLLYYTDLEECRPEYSDPRWHNRPSVTEDNFLMGISPIHNPLETLTDDEIRILHAIHRQAYLDGKQDGLRIRQRGRDGFTRNDCIAHQIHIDMMPSFFPDENPIRSARIRLGMSQQQLGEALGYKGRSAELTIQHIETGRRTITRTKVKRLAEILKMDPIDIL